MKRRARAIEASSSNESRASTSVETRPATCLRISRPNCTKSPSMAVATSTRASFIAASTRWRKRGSCAEVRRSDGLVVASCGFQRATASMSPVSATTKDWLRSESSWELISAIITDLDRRRPDEELGSVMQRAGKHAALHPMARINYAIRAGSFAYCFVVLAVHGAERGFGGFFWAALALQFLAYPHL